MVEITLKGATGDHETIYQALTHLEGKVSIKFTDGRLIMRGADIIQILPNLIEGIETAGLEPGEIRLRENTLEDVFIQLTGRRLRE